MSAQSGTLYMSEANAAPAAHARSSFPLLTYRGTRMLAAPAHTPNLDAAPWYLGPGSMHTWIRARATKALSSALTTKPES
eukprot:tig00020999_g16969.t1